MAFDKLIVKGLTGAAKSGIKMDLALDSLKEKMIDNISSRVEDEIPVQLPFDTRAVLLGGDLPPDLMSPETVNSVQKIPASQKAQINDTLDTVENTLNVVITQKNTLQGALNTIITPLSTLETLSNTIGGILTGLKAAVTTIKLLPIPTSVPPGVGLPVNVINGFSVALDTLKAVIDKFGGPLEIIPGAINQINALLLPITQKFATFDPIFDKIIKIIAFIRLLLSLPKDGITYQWDGTNWNQTTQPNPIPPNSLFGMVGDPNGILTGDFIEQYYIDGNSSGGDDSGVQQSDIDATLSNVAGGIQQSLAVTSPNSSNSNTNNSTNQALLDSLDPNSNNPLFYRGFRLVIEFDPNNTFSFPARRVRAYNGDEGVILYSVPPDQGSGEINTASTYSFSTSVEVLISEVKFNIDNYFISKSRTNEISPIITDLKKLISQRYSLLQSYQIALATQAAINDVRIDDITQKDIDNETNYINSLNEQLEFWEAQLDLSNSL